MHVTRGGGGAGTCTPHEHSAERSCRQASRHLLIDCVAAGSTGARDVSQAPGTRFSMSTHWPTAGTVCADGMFIDTSVAAPAGGVAGGAAAAQHCVPRTHLPPQQRLPMASAPGVPGAQNWPFCAQVQPWHASASGIRADVHCAEYLK